MQKDRTTHRRKFWRAFAVVGCFGLVIATCASLSGLGSRDRLPQEHPNGLTYQEVLETVEGLTIQPILPTWYPKGTMLEKMEYNHLVNGIAVDTMFARGEHHFYFSTCVYDGPHNSPDYQKTPGSVELYYSGQTSHYIMMNMDDYLVVWRNGNTENTIWGDLTEKELKKMIDSIYS